MSKKHFIAWNSNTKKYITDLFPESAKTLKGNYYLSSLTKKQILKKASQLEASGYTVEENEDER